MEASDLKVGQLVQMYDEPRNRYTPAIVTAVNPDSFDLKYLIDGDIATGLKFTEGEGFISPLQLLEPCTREEAIECFQEQMDEMWGWIRHQPEQLQRLLEAYDKRQVALSDFLSQTAAPSE